jgi:uncharacterized membrane protein required for colicin V production
MAGMNWLDWTMVAIVGLMALGGLRRGFIKSLVGLASQVGSLVAAFLLTRPVSIFLEERFHLAGQLGTILARHLRLPADFGRTTITNLNTGQLWAMLTESGLPEQYKDAVMTWVADSPAKANITLARFIQDSLGMLLLNAITFFALMMLVRLVIALLGYGVSGTVNALGAGPLDHLGGFALGAAQGAIICALILGLGMPLMGVDSASGVSAAVNASRFAPPLLEGFYQVTPWLRQIGQTVWERLR